MKFESSKLGIIEIDKNLVFEFVEPIVGFSDLRNYALVCFENNEVINWLQSLENRDIAFPVCSPNNFNISNYSFEISDDNVKKLGIVDVCNILALNILNIPQDKPNEATINLLAPVVINTENKTAMQLILTGSNFPCAKKIFN